MNEEKKSENNNPTTREIVLVIKNSVEHIEKRVDKFYQKISGIEKTLNKVKLNEQDINNIKADIHVINNKRIPSLKKNLKETTDNITETLKSKVNKYSFYIVLFGFTILNYIISYARG